MTGLRMSAMNVGPSVDTNLLVALAPGHLEIPTTAAVIVHPTHGVGLWDTGFNGAVADTERREAHWGVNAATAFAPHAFRCDHAVDAQLEKLGIEPKEVPYVLYSHLHLDHAGGMSYLPDAIHVVQRDEIRYAMSADTWTSPVYCGNGFRDIRKLEILEIDGDFDLFEDGSVGLLKTPGHSPGLPRCQLCEVLWRIDLLQYQHMQLIIGTCFYFKRMCRQALRY